MPGLTDNDRVTEALNQLIAAVNDVSMQLTALSGKIDTNLPAMVEWQEYLKYLEQIAERIGDVGSIQSDNNFSGDWSNPDIITGKCRVSNALFDHILYCCSDPGEKIQDIGQDNAGILLILVTFFTDKVLSISYGDYSAFIKAVSVGTLDLDNLCTKLTSAKSNIISDIYLATTGSAVKQAFWDNLTLTIPQTLWLGALLLPSGVTSSVLDERYWYSWADPENPISCGASPSSGCVNPNDRVLTTFWGFGTSLLINGNFVSGNSTGAWDYVIYHIVFGCMDDPIGTMTINSITTPSIDYLVETCDGTEYQVNECLAAQFPKTFHDVVYVSLARTSSNFTVSLSFS